MMNQGITCIQGLEMDHILDRGNLRGCEKQYTATVIKKNL